MSYPSVGALALKQGVDLSRASKAECERLLLQAFERDLPLGMKYLKRLANRARFTGKRLLRAENPLSPLGQQLIRLLGADIARGLVERRFGVAFGLYNCCGVTVAPKRKGRSGRKVLRMTPREQIALQNGEKSRANC